MDRILQSKGWAGHGISDASVRYVMTDQLDNYTLRHFLQPVSLLSGMMSPVRAPQSGEPCLPSDTILQTWLRPEGCRFDFRNSHIPASHTRPDDQQGQVFYRIW